MSIVGAKGARGRADRAFSKLIRARGRCIKCGTTDYASLQCMHIIGRRYSATRTYEPNALCGCWKCHRRFTDHPDEWMDFLDSLIGRDEYRRLKRKAEAGGKFGKSFWEAEAKRLEALVKQMEAAA